MKVVYGILTAVPKEMTYYLEQLQNRTEEKVDGILYYFGSLAQKNVVLTAAGWGTTCTAVIMTHLINHFKPRAVFFSGTAGGIKEGILQGEVVIGESAFEIDMFNLISTCKNTPFEAGLIHDSKKEIQPPEYFSAEELISTARKVSQTAITKFYIGRLATTNHFPLRISDYKLIKEKNTFAIAMEGSAVYQTSWLLSVPSLVVRGISMIYHPDGTDTGIQTAQTQLASDNAAKVVIEILKEINNGN